ncbi:MAG: c-type cytochrome [Sulfurovum sp.]|nr:c-type cytochrome [Sulfurovaceae bacterium]
MNGLMIKGLAFAAVLMIATLGVVMSMDIDLSDPINLITMIGALVISVLTVGVSVKYINQMKTDTASGELADENWDGIGEYKNELPSGWAFSFLATLIWAVWYWFVGYPVNAFSQIGQYNEEVLAHQEKFEAKFKNADTDTLKEIGESIFLVQCAPCHGETGDGLSGKSQDFASRGSEAQILDIIENGSDQLHYPMGAMPGGMASGNDAKIAAKYVASGMKGDAPAAFGVCAGCHGADGKGNGGMSPNIVEYDNQIIKHVLENGKQGSIGMMPSFKGRFTEVQEKALATYIQSIQQ